MSTSSHPLVSPKRFVPSEKSIDLFLNSYEAIGGWILEVGQKVVLSDSSLVRTCRFCGKKEGEVTFQKLAHAVPESLGNKSLSSTYECDECNQFFGNGIEDHFGRWSSPMRFVSQIRGKNGVPKLTNGSKGFRMEVTVNGVEIRHYEGDHVVEVDEENRRFTVKFIKDTYTPIAVFKAFVKMALTVMPADELQNFETELQWIREPDHTRSHFEGPVISSFVTGQRPFDQVALFLYRRKSSAHVPYCIFVLAYGNEMFQVCVPSLLQDKLINNVRIDLPIVPNPFDLTTDAKVVRVSLDLTSDQPVKGDELSVCYGYESGTFTDHKEGTTRSI